MATYKQVHGRASTFNTLEARGYARGPNLLQQPHTESQIGCYTPGVSAMRGYAAFVTSNTPMKMNNTCCCTVPA